MAMRLRAYKPSVDGTLAQNVFRDCLVGNVRELAQLIPSINITGSVKIKKLAESLKYLADLAPQILRDDARQREITAVRTEKIFKKDGDFI